MDKKQFTVEKRWLSRLFTTFAMILLIVFVLSTATFAWYSVANVAGTTGDVSFKAGSMQEGEGGDLCISWSYNDTHSYSISFADFWGPSYTDIFSCLFKEKSTTFFLFLNF